MRISDWSSDVCSSDLCTRWLEYFCGSAQIGRKENAVSSPGKILQISSSLADAYDQAWSRYEARCLWNVQRVAQPTAEDARDVAQRLRDRKSTRLNSSH